MEITREISRMMMINWHFSFCTFISHYVIYEQSLETLELKTSRIKFNGNRQLFVFTQKCYADDKQQCRQYINIKSWPNPSS